ncbi:ion transporter [uncultured Ruminococcus sp.]|uniref:ion transporter n=1 Tax=uncultured Ruminococcus sp. TaxID=165186 RepID=UPI0025DEEF9F|nr:ion transporter [uncultured Ruminococcus sp.]
MYKTIKSKAFELVNHNKIFEVMIIILIVINTSSVVAETFQLPDNVKGIMSVIETISVIIFTFEYILRVWTADTLKPELSPVKARLKYVFSFMAVIDLLAIMPFYLPMLIPIDLRALRTLRLVRLLRLFKINRYTKALSTIAEVFKRKASQLISSLLVVGLLMLIAALIMYNIEHEAQPETFTNVFQALWWSVATLTTVGYGDIYPVTIAGKVLSTIIALLGIGLVAVPTGIITAGFSEVIDKDDDKDKKYCPYCGHKID